MANSSESIIRLLQILHTTDEKSPMNATQIMDIMENHYQQKMVRDTVYHGIQTLQRCGYDIEQCRDKRHGWYMQKHEFEDWQLKLLYDSVTQARCITEEETRELQKKLLRLTSSRGAHKIRSIFAPAGRNITDDPYLGSYLDLMMDAIDKGKKVRFQYTELDDNMNRILRKNGKFYELSIYALYWSNDTYYVIGGHEKLLEKRELTNYRLDRMVNLGITEDGMIEAEEFLGKGADTHLQEYIDRQVGHYSGKLIPLVLEFDPEPRTLAILADFAGTNLNISHLPDGRLRASMVRMDSEALHGWLMEYILRFTVIEPEKLRAEITEMLKMGLEKYQTEE